MDSQNFTSTFTVDQSPEQVFAAIVDVPRWWTGDVEGNTDTLGDEFTYRYPGAHYSKQKIAELIPGKKVVWHVVDAQLEGPKDPNEWTGTEISFEITPDGRLGPRSTSRTSVWCPISSALTPVRAPGAFTSTEASSA